MTARTNLMKQRLSDGGAVLGCGLHESRGPDMVHVIAAAGADFVFIDLEHNPLSLETVADQTAHAHSLGITPLVRIPQIDVAWVTRVLDLGCQSLYVPHVSSPDEIDRLIELAYFAPQGNRGVGLYGHAASGYDRPTDLRAVADWQNSQLLIGLVIETVGAVERIDELLRPEIGFVTIGLQDLSQAYGLLGQVDHPTITDAVEHVRTRCRAAGVPYGVGTSTPNGIDTALGAGAQVIFYGGVLSFVRKAVQEGAAALAAAHDPTKAKERQ